MTGMRFSTALEAMRAGERVARSGWNGKGMWIMHVRNPLRFVMSQPVRHRNWENGDVSSTYDSIAVHLEPFFVMRTADGKFIPWLASQTDLQAEDWEEVPWRPIR